MIGSLVILALIASTVIALRVRVVLRRRADRIPLITTWPDIELSQRYGGWNADAYDAGTGRATASSVAPSLYLSVGSRLPAAATRQR